MRCRQCKFFTCMKCKQTKIYSQAVFCWILLCRCECILTVGEKVKYLRNKIAHIIAPDCLFPSFWIEGFSSVLPVVLLHLSPSFTCLCTFAQDPPSALQSFNLCLFISYFSLQVSLSSLLLLEFFICGQRRMVRFRLDPGGAEMWSKPSLDTVRSRGQACHAWSQWGHHIPFRDNLFATSLCAALARKLSIT